MNSPRQEYVENLEKLVREEYLEKIKQLEHKIDFIIKKLDSMEKDTNKMSNHIDFIDVTYSKFKMPLFWMCDRINLLRGFRKETEVIKSSIEEQD